MKKPISRLVLAAVLLSSLPLAASADGWDRPDGARPGGWSTPATPAPPPAAYPGYRGYGEAYPGYPGQTRDPREWREHRWRDRELAEVTAQLRALDAQRDRFYAEYRFRPGKLRRYDRWYAERRAELERRWSELQRVAWR